VGVGDCTLKAGLNDNVVGITTRNKTQRNNSVLCALLKARRVNVCVFSSNNVGTLRSADPLFMSAT